jgi:hypothetical protein
MFVVPPYRWPCVEECNTTEIGADGVQGLGGVSQMWILSRCKFWNIFLLNLSSYRLFVPIEVHYTYFDGSKTTLFMKVLAVGTWCADVLRVAHWLPCCYGREFLLFVWQRLISAIKCTAGCIMCMFSYCSLIFDLMEKRLGEGPHRDVGQDLENVGARPILSCVYLLFTLLFTAWN